MIRQRRQWIAVVMILFIVTTVFSNRSFAKNRPYKSSLLMDGKTGQILSEYNAHKRVIPASIVKMMVLLLVMEKIDAGKIHLSDIVTVSAWASKIGGHQVYLAEGEKFSLVELLKAVAISSANDAATAVAEYLAGSTEACVDMMNARAEELGMNDTMFANVHGLPPDKGQKENYTSAYDIALLAQELLEYPQLLAWTSIVEDTFRDGTFTLTNTNRQLLRNYRGVDGLKTGFHPRGAGFNVCVTAKRDDQRLIAVVLGASQKVDRHRAIVELLNLGFNQFEKIVVLRKGFPVGDPILVARGKRPTTTLVASDNVTIFVKKGQEQEIRQEVNIPVDHIVAPVSRGARYGEVVLFLGEQFLTKVDLVTEDDLPEGSLVERLKWWILDKVS